MTRPADHIAETWNAILSGWRPGPHEIAVDRLWTWLMELGPCSPEDIEATEEQFMAAARELAQDWKLVVHRDPLRIELGEDHRDVARMIAESRRQSGQTVLGYWVAGR